MIKKLLAVLAITMIACLIPAGFYLFIQQRFPDLGMIPVIENFIPWIFHLLVWQFAALIWMGMMLVAAVYWALSGSSEEPIIEDKSPKRKPRKKPKKSPKAARKQIRKQQPKKEAAAVQPGKESPDHPTEWDEEEFE